jgi:membrane carboxypeptidase/penicillin-binding protein
MVAIDPKTGQILAMVGSRDYFNQDIDGAVNVTTSARQPGSSFKPFVYATALEKGYTPDTDRIRPADAVFYFMSAYRHRERHAAVLQPFKLRRHL